MSTANELTATQAAAKIASGELSAVDLMQACLARIAEREDDVQAWVFLDTERAMNLAREADALRASGKGLGPLHGVPVGIKDIIDTADMPTQNGSPMFQGRTTNYDAACVNALRDAGAIILGKTVTTELANSFPNKTHNPHNLEYSPGGSSSGAGYPNRWLGDPAGLVLRRLRVETYPRSDRAQRCVVAVANPRYGWRVWPQRRGSGFDHRLPVGT
jgi:Asp-tRNA(Asn)/Glu-tRNA(Gln) amidotransferase A subunit family amidase